jgi:hypothetical protein
MEASEKNTEFSVLGVDNAKLLYQAISLRYALGKSRLAASSWDFGSAAEAKRLRLGEAIK